MADQQGALVRALVAGGPIPGGVDSKEVAVASKALLRKRAGEIAFHDPLIPHACGDRFQVLFAEWATGRPKQSTRSDAEAFVRHLRTRGIRVRPRRFGIRLRRR
ncbi:hypothetical protein ACNHUS_07950 [Actinomycetes bacterium M1A6_2h]